MKQIRTSSELPEIFCMQHIPLHHPLRHTPARASTASASSGGLPYRSRVVQLALLLSLGLRALPSQASEPAPSQGWQADPERASAVAQARQHFARGVELYRGGAYDASLAAFTRAYELAPTYRILYNLAQVQAQRQDYVQALELFARYLREGATAPAEARIPDARVAQVEAEMSELKRRVAELRIETNVEGGVLIVNETRVAELPLRAPLLLNAGIHRVRVEKPGHIPVTRIVTVAGGDASVVSFELQRESFPIDLNALPAPHGLPSKTGREAPPAPPENVPVKVGLISTGILAGFTAACAVMTYRQSGELDRRLSHYPDGLEQIESARSRLRTLAVLTDAFGLASVVSAGVTTYFHFAPPKEPERRSPQLGAGLGPDGLNVWVRGSL
jgi:tetratricopeptide (TPR) repeat protein